MMFILGIMASSAQIIQSNRWTTNTDNTLINGNTLTNVNAASLSFTASPQPVASYTLANTNYLIVTQCPYPPGINTNWYWNPNFIISHSGNIQINGAYTNAYGWFEGYDQYSADPGYQGMIILSNSPTLSNTIYNGSAVGWGLYSQNTYSSPVYTNSPATWVDYNTGSPDVPFLPNITWGVSATNYTGTNQNFAQFSLPPTNATVIIYPDNMFYYAGTWYSNSDETLTISNAWNYLAQAPNGTTPGGNICWFAPGLYQIGDFPLTYPPPNYNYNPASLDMEGAGETATVFLNTNQTPTDTFHLGTVQNLNGTCLYLHKFVIATVTNAPGTILLFVGAGSVGTGGGGNGAPVGPLGGVAKADIGDVTFAYWNDWTNWVGLLTPNIGAPEARNEGVIALYVTNRLGDDIVIHNCHFDVVAGVLLCNDHGVFENNMFENCACQTNQINSIFPSTNIFYAGAYVNIVAGNDGPNNAWKIGGNEFVSLTTNLFYLFDNVQKSYDIYEDDFERLGSGAPIVATTGAKVNFVGGFSGVGPWPDTNLCVAITNSATTWGPPYQPDMNLCQIVQFGDGLSEFSFNAINPANVFAGSYEAKNGVAGYTGNETNVIGALTNIIYYSGGIITNVFTY